MRDATQAQLDFMATELPRFEAIGAWERGHCNKWVSRMFLVPKPGTNKWRLIIDLRELNKWCRTFTMSYETLKHLRHLARAGDWFVSMDLADGYYALGIREEDRDFFTVNYRGELWRLACLPMGWTGSSYYFCKLTAAFTDYLRTPLKRRDPALPPTAPSKPTRRFLRNTRWRGERLLPYMDDFLFLADSREAALELRVRLSTLLDRLGLLRNPNKGVWEPTQVGPHLGLIIDPKRGEFRAPEEKLIALAKADAGVETLNRLLFVQTGFGCDQHGDREVKGATTAAVRACRNAIEFNSIPGIIEAVPGGRKNMIVHVKLGVPSEYHVDVNEVAKVFPYGKLLPIDTVAGGLTYGCGRVVPELGDLDDTAIVVCAAVSIGYHQAEEVPSAAGHKTWDTRDGH
eukprot:jgi/Tetstr1/445543/TSEL_033317.t1